MFSTGDAGEQREKLAITQAGTPIASAYIIRGEETKIAIDSKTPINRSNVVNKAIIADYEVKENTDDTFQVYDKMKYLIELNTLRTSSGGKSVKLGAPENYEVTELK